MGNVEIIDYEPNQDLLLSCARNFDVVATWGKVTKDMLTKGERLKFVNLLSTGYFHHNLDPNIVASDLANSNVVISYTPNYSTGAVANYSVAAALSGIHKLAFGQDMLSNEKPLGTFQTRAYADYKVGILGMGNIGASVAERFSALGFSVQYFSRSPKSFPYKFVESIEDLFATSNVLSIHLPLSPETEGMVGSSLLELLPTNAVIINSARARLFRLDELISYLRTHPECIAIVDQLEPFVGCSITLPSNLKITPHIAYDNLDAHYKRTQIAADNIEAFLNGAPINIIKIS
jgi:phosphoglycerate dehydrogenase-like enzyme